MSPLALLANRLLWSKSRAIRSGMHAAAPMWFAAFGCFALMGAASAQQRSPAVSQPHASRGQSGEMRDGSPERAPPDPRVRVDGLAAVVGGLTPGPGTETILRSDVALRARITWAGEGGALQPLEPLPDALLHATLQQMIRESLIAREAQRVRVASPSDAEVARALQRLQHAAGGAERLSRLVEALGATTQELEAIARRRVRVAAFLKANLEGVTVVTDAEVERFLQREEHDLNAEDPEIVRQRARALLARSALDRAVERWVRVLKDRVPVRIYASWAGAVPP